MARLELRGAEAALDNLIVRAPIDGTVLQINVRAGELASPSAPQPLVVLGDRLETARARRDRRARLRRRSKSGTASWCARRRFAAATSPARCPSIAPIIEAGRIGARGQRNLTDVNVAEVVIDLAEPGPLAVGMKVDVYFSRDASAEFIVARKRSRTAAACVER